MDLKLYYNSLPKKAIGAGVLFFNENNQLLIVNPIYKKKWTIPGGTVEKNESPHKACIREIKEELGININSLEFLGVEYLNKENIKIESLQFIFYGGILTKHEISKIKLEKEELSEYKFINLYIIKNYLKLSSANRILKCLEAYRKNSSIYLESRK